MEDNLIKEQPTEEQATVSDETLVKSADSEGGSLNNLGVNFGKFKSADALFEAYKALEAEFTRKSQRLSELEKDKTEKATINENFINDELSSFLSRQSDASPFADELKNLSIQQGGRVDFDNLWASLLVNKLASGESKLDNPIIKKYVFQDEELKNHVIENYMKELKSNQPPFVICRDNGERVTGQKPVTPSSLAEAKKLVEDLFS